MTHELKTWPEFLQDIILGDRQFEIRKNDRNFKQGDILILQGWDNKKECYRGKEVEVEVTHILHGGQFGIEPGYVVMGIKTISMTYN